MADRSEIEQFSRVLEDHDQILELGRNYVRSVLVSLIGDAVMSSALFKAAYGFKMPNGGPEWPPPWWPWPVALPPPHFCIACGTITQQVLGPEIYTTVVVANDLQEGVNNYITTAAVQFGTAHQSVQSAANSGGAAAL